jgi:hypothetical protein
VGNVRQELILQTKDKRTTTPLCPMRRRVSGEEAYSGATVTAKSCGTATRRLNYASRVRLSRAWRGKKAPFVKSLCGRADLLFDLDTLDHPTSHLDHWSSLRTACRLRVQHAAPSWASAATRTTMKSRPPRPLTSWSHQRAPLSVQGPQRCTSMAKATRKIFLL